MILTKADHKKGATEARQAGRGHMPCRSCERLLSTFQVPQEPNKGFEKESDSGDVHCLKIMVAVAGRGLKRRPRRLGQDGRGWTSRCNGDESWGQAGVRFGGGAGKTGCLMGDGR